MDGLQENSKAAADVIETTLEGWREAIVSNFPQFVLALVLFVLIWLFAGLISKLIGKLFLGRVKNKALVGLAQSVFKVLIIAIGGFLALSILGLDKALTTLLAGAGIAGLAIGFALQAPIGNLFSGVMLSFRDTLNIGDWVETNGFAGEVVGLDLKATTLKEADNNMVVLPNQTILSNPYKNFSLTNRSRVIVTSGVAYDSDLKEVQNVVLDTLASTFDHVRKEDIIFYFDDFGESSITFTARFWMTAKNSIDVVHAKSEAIIALKAAFNKHNIEIPYPVRTIVQKGG